jgi:molybdate transport system substrate-binding protein
VLAIVAALLLGGCAGTTSHVANTPAAGVAPFRVGSPQGAERTLTVSAAISLSDVLEEIAGAYRRGGGAAIRLNLASSNALARQIVSGAPVDVFVSADQAQIDVAARAAALVRHSETIVAANQLVVVAAPGRVHDIAQGFRRAAPGIRRLAIGDPSGVPAGVYARAYLEGQGLWSAYHGRLIPTPNVRAVLAAVEHGGADAGIVYATDARHSRRVAVALSVPLDQSPFIGYYAAIVSRAADEEEARRFLRFLRGDDAKRIFAGHGFLPVPPGR